LDVASTERLVSAVNEHTRAGGLAIVATHLPLALERARTLELVSLRMAA
jgi:heme exporter protein A